MPRKLSPEHKQKLSAAQKRNWSKRKGSGAVENREQIAYAMRQLADALKPKAQTYSDPTEMFRQYPAAPGVVPKSATLAMDANPSYNAASWAMASAFGAAAHEGITFLGYPYLSELSQRTEYRTAVETIAEDMTSRWIDIKSKGGEDKTERISAIADEFERLDVRGVFRRLAELDGFFGRGHLFIDLGDDLNSPELAMSIGDGWNGLSKLKLAHKPIKRLAPIEPIWTYPAKYDAFSPLRKDWYMPDSWYVQGSEIHVSRLMRFVSREVPDMLKPAYAFGGLPLTQMLKPYVDNWLRTRQSVSDLIHSFTVFVMQTDLSQILQGESANDLIARMDLFNSLRDNAGLMALDKDAEDLKNISVPLSGLNDLQAQSQEHLCSAAKIPTVKYLGIQPAGLNASSEGEIRVYEDGIMAQKTKIFLKPLRALCGMVQFSLFGDADPDIIVDFEPQHTPNELEEATIRKTNADVDNAYIDHGVLSPEEPRKRLSTDPDSGYSGIDVDDMPELPEEGEAPETLSDLLSGALNGEAGNSDSENAKEIPPAS